MSSEIFAEISSLSSQGLLVVDATGADASIVYANPAYEAMSGYRLADLEGSNWLAHAAADEESPDVVRLRQQLALDELHQQSMPFLRKDGDIWFAALKLIPLKSGAEGRKLWLIEHPIASGMQGASAELLKRALGRARRKLASLDRTDPVTGLMAREHFEMLLRHELAVARREERQLTLMLFSVPELEIYRQTFGDNAADSCLRMIAAQISGTFRRASDLCARLEPSLLAVAALGQSDEQAAHLVALVEKKSRNLGLHNPRGRLGRHVVVRGVFSHAESDSDDIEALIARARKALASQADPEEAPVTSPV